eukprot:g55267.t1
MESLRRSHHHESFQISGWSYQDGLQFDYLTATSLKRHGAFLKAVVAGLLGGYVAQARNTIQIVEPSPDGEVAVISRPAVPFPKKTGSRKEGRPEHILLVRRVVQGGTLDKPLYQNFFLPYNKIDPTVSASLPRISTEEYKATITPDLAKTKPGAVPHDRVLFVPYFKPLPLVQALTESRPTRECTKGPKNYNDSVSLAVLTPDGGDEQAELTGTVPAEKSKKSKHKKPGKNKDKPQKTKPESPTSGQSTAPMAPPVVPGLPVLPDTTPQLQGEQLHSSEMVDRMFSMFDKMIKEKQKHNSEQNAKLMEVLRPTKPTGHDQDSQPASNELVIVTRTPTGTENQVHSVNGGSPNGGELIHYNPVHNSRNGGKGFRLQPQEIQVDAFAHQSALLPVMAYHNMTSNGSIPVEYVRVSVAKHTLRSRCVCLPTLAFRHCKMLKLNLTIFDLGILIRTRSFNTFKKSMSEVEVIRKFGFFPLNLFNFIGFDVSHHQHAQEVDSHDFPLQPPLTL